MIRRPPRSTQSRSSAASDVYKRQVRGSWSTSVSNGLTHWWIMALLFPLVIWSTVHWRDRSPNSVMIGEKLIRLADGEITVGKGAQRKVEMVFREGSCDTKYHPTRSCDSHVVSDD